MIKYSFGLKGSNGRVIALFPVIAIILCMLFPVYVDDHFSWDLRWIPFILGALYGGYKLGSVLLIIVLIMRYFQGGENGFYIAVIIFSVIGIIAILLSKHFLQMTLKQKLIVTMTIVIFGLFSSLLLSYKVFFIDLQISFWLQYIGIHIVGMFMLTVLWEVVQTNFKFCRDSLKRRNYKRSVILSRVFP